MKRTPLKPKSLVIPEIPVKPLRTEGKQERAAIKRLWLIAIVMLIAAVAANRYGLGVAGLNFRFELIVGGLLAVWCLLHATTVRPLGTIGLIEWCLIGWLAVSAISSLLFSPAPQESLRLTVLVAGFLMLYGVGFMLLRSAQAVNWAAAAWVAVGSVVALVGFIEAILYIMFGWHVGITLEGNYQGNVFTVTPKVHSTLWEPNIFGSYCLTVGMLALALGHAPTLRQSRWQRWLQGAAACAFCGVMLSMTRTVWLVGPLLLVVAAVASLWLKLTSWQQLPRVFLAPVIGIIIGVALGLSMPTASVRAAEPLTTKEIEQVFRSAVTRGPVVAEDASSSPSKGSALIDRISGFSNAEQVSSFVGRRRIYELAFEGWLQRPLLGWGTGAFAYYSTIGDKWVGNLELHILFDTGIVGLLLLGVAAGMAIWRGVRLLKAPSSDGDLSRFILFGLILGSIGLFLAYQTTEGMWLGFTWVFFAFLVAAGRYAPTASFSCPPDKADPATAEACATYRSALATSGTEKYNPAR